MLLLAQPLAPGRALVVEFRNAKEAAELANLRLVEQMEERERAEAALRQAQRIEAVGRLTGGVAHDFNNLLTVVRATSSCCRGRRASTSRTHDLLDAMRAAAERGATLTGQLLAFARRQPLVPRPVDLNAVIDGMQDLLRQRARQRDRDRDPAGARSVAGHGRCDADRAGGAQPGDQCTRRHAARRRR